MNKYIITIIVALMAFSIGAKAQTVYSCQYKSEADVKVHVTKYKSEADLVVYKCKYKSEADIVIYFTDYKSEAGWRNNSKNI